MNCKKQKWKTDSYLKSNYLMRGVLAFPHLLVQTPTPNLGGYNAPAVWRRAYAKNIALYSLRECSQSDKYTLKRSRAAS